MGNAPLRMAPGFRWRLLALWYLAAAEEEASPKAAKSTGCGLARRGPLLRGRLARLSSPGLAASADSPRLLASGRRCTGRHVQHLAVALRVPAPAVRRLRARCRRGRGCPRRPGSRADPAAPAAGTAAWFAACVPLACLGHDSELRTYAWQLLWYRLAGVRAGLEPPAEGVDVQILHLFGEAEGSPIPEVQLAHESLEGAGEDGPFDVVTVTDAPDRAAGLLNSVPWPLRLRFLRPAPTEKPWRFRWFDTERHLLSYVAFLRRRGLGDRLVVYADGFDTAWLGCTRDLRAALEALGRDVFFGVEFDLYPAGLAGYPRPARSHSAVAENFGKERGRPLPFCREPQPLMERWELDPPNETEPCLAVTQDDLEAVFLNGGVYGGRAAALERALRRFLGRQRLLTVNQCSGSAYRVSGRTHQYLWNQYFLDRSHEVGLDYGGSFVVNLARRSLAPQQFGLAEDTASMRSVVFQRPICIAHANGAGYADSTLSLLRAAATFRFDTTALVGIRPEDFDEISMGHLKADADKGDRILLDTAMCFARMKPVTTWHGALAAVDLVIPEHFATYQGMQFVVLRYKGSKSGRAADRGGQKGGSRAGLEHFFDVVEAQHTPLWKHGGARQNTTIFSSRNRFDISPFRLHVRQGDCVGWRCQGRCDVAYADFTGAEDTFAPDIGGPDSGLLRRGAWLGRLSRDIQIGDTLTLSTWKPRAYIMGILAEVSGIGFYEPEDGG